MACKGCNAYLEKNAPFVGTCFSPNKPKDSDSGVVAAHKLFEQGLISRAVYARLLEQDIIYHNTARHGWSDKQQHAELSNAKDIYGDQLPQPDARTIFDAVDWRPVCFGSALGALLTAGAGFDSQVLYGTDGVLTVHDMVVGRAHDLDSAEIVKVAAKNRNSTKAKPDCHALCEFVIKGAFEGQLGHAEMESTGSAVNETKPKCPKIRGMIKSQKAIPVTEIVDNVLTSTNAGQEAPQAGEEAQQAGVKATAQEAPQAGEEAQQAGVKATAQEGPQDEGTVISTAQEGSKHGGAWSGEEAAAGTIRKFSPTTKERQKRRARRQAEDEAEAKKLVGEQLVDTRASPAPPAPLPPPLPLHSLPPPMAGTTSSCSACPFDKYLGRIAGMPGLRVSADEHREDESIQVCCRSTVNGIRLPVRAGDRVVTVYSVSEGGDGSPYAGFVNEVRANGDVTVLYDDGEIWSVPALEDDGLADCYLESFWQKEDNRDTEKGRGEGEGTSGRGEGEGTSGELSGSERGGCGDDEGSSLGAVAAESSGVPVQEEIAAAAGGSGAPGALEAALAAKEEEHRAVLAEKDATLDRLQAKLEQLEKASQASR
jgi:hypothetical protein